MLRQSEDRLADCRAILVRQTPHHAEVEPDDLTAAHPDVPRMRVGVEVAILDDLLDVILTEPLADAPHVDARRLESRHIVNLYAVDVLHDEHMLRRQMAIDLGTAYEVGILIRMAELLDVVRLHDEIHLLLGDRPKLIEHHAEIHDILRRTEDLQDARRTLQEHDVLAHDVVHARSLHLDDDLLTVQEHGAMHLRNRSRTQRFFINRAEDARPATLILLLDDLLYDGKRQGVRLRLQFHKFIAVFLRQKIRTHAHDLPEFHESRSEIFQDQPQLLGRYAMHDVARAQDFNHLAQTRRRALILLAPRFAKSLCEHRIPPRKSPHRHAGRQKPCLSSSCRTFLRAAGAPSRFPGIHRMSSRGRQRPQA